MLLARGGVSPPVGRWHEVPKGLTDRGAPEIYAASFFRFGIKVSAAIATSIMIVSDKLPSSPNVPPVHSSAFSASSN